VTLPFATVDLTRQRVKLSSTLFGSADECWLPDGVIKSLALEGLLDVSFEPNEPTNYRRLWFDMGNPPTGNMGILKIWDADQELWVRLTPQLYNIYIQTVGRQRWWYTSKLSVGTVRPPDHEVIIGDFWEHDTAPNDNELSIWRQLGPNNLAWVDLTGGGLDPVAVRTLLPTFTILNPGDSWPSLPKYRDEAYVATTATIYTWLPSPDRWEDITN
jgi:hypothetical protein